MTNAIQIFNYQNTPVKTLVEGDRIWFSAKEVCGILEYTNHRRAIKMHCKEKGVTKRYALTNGGRQLVTYIDEPNLYRLTTKSEMPEAEGFEEWVFEDVLPTIRKTGGYGQPQQRVIQPVDLAAIGGTVKRCTAKAVREALSETAAAKTKKQYIDIMKAAQLRISQRRSQSADIVMHVTKAEQDWLKEQRLNYWNDVFFAISEMADAALD